MVVVDKVVAIGLVGGALDAAAQFGQDHDLEVVVLQKDSGVLFVLFFVQDLVNDRVGVDLAGGTLVDTLFQEHWVLVGLAHTVSGNGDGLGPDLGFMGSILHDKTSLVFAFSASYTRENPAALAKTAAEVRQNCGV